MPSRRTKKRKSWRSCGSRVLQALGIRRGKQLVRNRLVGLKTEGRQRFHRGVLVERRNQTQYIIASPGVIWNQHIQSYWRAQKLWGIGISTRPTREKRVVFRFCQLCWVSDVLMRKFTQNQKHNLHSKCEIRHREFIESVKLSVLCFNFNFVLCFLGSMALRIDTALWDESLNEGMHV